MAGRDNIPLPSEIAKGLHLPSRVAHNVWRFLHAGVFGNWDAGTTVLPKVRDYLARVLPDDFQDARVEPLHVVRTNDYGDEIESEDVGYFIDRGDWAWGELVYLDGSYLTWDGKKHVKRVGYFIDSHDDIEQEWQDWRISKMTRRDVEDEGPREDDYWTEDANTFYSYRYGETRADRRGAGDPVAFKVAKWSLPMRLGMAIETAEGKLDELEGAYDYAAEHGDRREMGAISAQMTDVRGLLQRLRRKYGGLPPDDEWDGSEAAYSEAQRRAVWAEIEKGMEKVGYFGNVWFRRTRGHGRVVDWHLVEPPADRAVWARQQAWRKRAKTARAVVSRFGARPQRGDLVTYGLYSRAPYGIVFHVYGDPELPGLHVSRAEAAAGRGAMKLWAFVDEWSKKSGRPVAVWKASAFSDPLSWQRIMPPAGGVPSEPIEGLRRAR